MASIHRSDFAPRWWIVGRLEVDQASGGALGTSGCDSASRRFSQGLPCATMSADDRYLPLCIRRNRTATPVELISSLRFKVRKIGINVNRASKASRTGSLCGVTSHLSPTHVRPWTGTFSMWTRQHIHWTNDLSMEG
ncbi:hypothetical protein TNCV_1282791 [Trichonephila clavipes]|uniref:Uncharacterized protein n=1 Tax=Trichonephila clavipes TaxID=2585209 RepID=A0A8X6SNY8_TRICX|nr:hypothetical protein TNCV_1282791 [Trichonephila clavipes]